MSSQQGQAQLQKVFDALDTDKNGVIDQNELTQAFKQGGLELQTNVVQRMMSYVGAKDGANLEQFAKLSALLSQFDQTFKEADSDKNGAIDNKELGRILADLGHNLSSTEIATLVKSVDADNSGEIEFNEFVDLAFLLMISENK
eukprot:CAMPEP_0201551978 /NCGR_PEP_ID=MMETSP0173_2-20130828/12176_1 /ASSEMBLY_ACC=CAM_ASM_000268 /TAXON_ID=218659 /ORGANISM="Vexillifera sp., Strain DIVA3 564/2" /LENGTH=143 /DNA_ID=CAMNT_0047962357 /DNA_START=41 /DNA_END=469 /DNA_ORIENTATION=-